MSGYYMGQIFPLAFPFAPKNFALCAGQILAIQQNQALFSLLGTTYGGNGVTTFALPDLRGRAVLGFGNGGQSTTNLGQVGGTETVTLISTQMPMHNHLVQATTVNGTTRNPNGAIYASTTAALHTTYPGGSPVLLGPSTLDLTGGTQPHPNMQPYQVINFSIALVGIYPSRN